MRSKVLSRTMVVTASTVAVLGGGTYALASGSPAASGTTYHACIVTHVNAAKFPSRSLWKVSARPVTCPKGEPSISWNQAGPRGRAGAKGDTGPAGPAGPQGPAGVVGSVTTRNVADREADSGVPVTDVLACKSGEIAISGGLSVAGATSGITVLQNRPTPETGTPTGWQVEVRNQSGGPVTVTSYVECAAS